MVAANGIGRLLREMTPILRGVAEALAPVQMLGKSSKLPGDQFAKQQMLLKERMGVLVHRGWFVDPEMPLSVVRLMTKAFECDEAGDAEKWFVDYYISRGCSIIQKVCEKFPERSEIIADAFAAHNEGRFSLSVPVFLAQADGIADDCYRGRQIYSRRKSKGVCGLASSAQEGSAEWTFLSVYAENSPLVKDTKDLCPGFNGLNRHGVLHGTDKRYGTQINSLRALSVLAYAAFALKSEK